MSDKIHKIISKLESSEVGDENYNSAKTALVGIHKDINKCSLEQSEQIISDAVFADHTLGNSSHLLGIAKGLSDLPDIKNEKLEYNEKVTLSWLWHNVPFSMWAKAVGVLLFVFTLGLYLSGVPAVTNILNHLPGYKNINASSSTSNIQDKTYELTWTNVTSTNIPPANDIPIDTRKAHSLSIEAEPLNISDHKSKKMNIIVLASAIKDGKYKKYFPITMRNNEFEATPTTPYAGFLKFRLNVNDGLRADMKVIVRVVY